MKSKRKVIELCQRPLFCPKTNAFFRLFSRFRCLLLTVTLKKNKVIKLIFENSCRDFANMVENNSK